MKSCASCRTIYTADIASSSTSHPRLQIYFPHFRFAKLSQLISSQAFALTDTRIYTRGEREERAQSRMRSFHGTMLNSPYCVSRQEEHVSSSRLASEYLEEVKQPSQTFQCRSP